MDHGAAVGLGDWKASQATSGLGEPLKPIRVAIVDRFLVVRQGIRRMLASAPEAVTVAESDSVENILERITRGLVDLLLIDPELGQTEGHGVMERVCYRRPALRILLFATFCRDCDIDFALRVGASGYILKSTPVAALISAVRRVASGSTYFCEAAAARIVAGSARSSVYPVSRLSTLTDREASVLRHLAKGLPAKMIAAELGIALKTVENHRTNIMVKLNIHDRVELCRFAVREGIIAP